MKSQNSIAKKRIRLSGRNSSRAAAVITIQDRRRLGSLIADDDVPLARQAAQKLEEKLEEAAYIEQKEPLIVAMHDKVELADVSTNESRVATLVFPGEADVIDHSISVAKPLGLALLGSAVGSVIQCGDGPGATNLKILRIIE
jgi:regulator of nucleoside diphosphate kinase